jgi:ankyrin repeat protein
MGLVKYASDGDWNMVALLLKKGADPNQVNEDGTTALMFACCSGKEEIVRLLIKKGADVNMICKRKFTALSDAVASDYYEIAKILLENGATLKFNYCDKPFIDYIIEKDMHFGVILEEMYPTLSIENQNEVKKIRLLALFENKKKSS